MRTTKDFNVLESRLRNRLDAELYEVACAGFRREKSAGFEEDVGLHVRGGDPLYVAEVNGRVEGFAVFVDYLQLNAVYISGLVKSPNAPPGVIDAIVRYHVARCGRDRVVVRTQNDRVAEIMIGCCAPVVPLDERPGESEVELVRRMGLVTRDFDRGSMVVRGHYGQPMIGDGSRQRSSYPRVTKATDKLDYEAGDALLLVGYVATRK